MRICNSLALLCAAILLLNPTLGFGGNRSGLPNPHPRALVIGDQLWQWNFEKGQEGWSAKNHCSVGGGNGTLDIQATGDDPYLAAPVNVVGNQLVVCLRIKSTGGGSGQLFWSSDRHPGAAADRNVTFRMNHDNQWHEITVAMPIEGNLTALRLDPGTSAGEISVDWIRIHRGGPHPLEIAAVEQSDEKVHVLVRNHSETPATARVNDTQLELPPEGETRLELQSPSSAALAPMTIRVESDLWPAIARQIWVYRPQASLDGVFFDSGKLRLEASRDGSVVRIQRSGVTVAALAPLVHRDYQLPELQLVNETWPIEYRGAGISVRIATAGADTLSVRIAGNTPVEGPVVRTFGRLEQGLLAGVEYLGRGEHSSSTLDIETAEHLRVKPEPMDLTMPLMATVTDLATVAVRWDDMSLQPVFAVPDFLDGAAGYRLAIEGKLIETEIRITDGWEEGGRLEGPILWAAQRHGLPPLPEVPRPYDEQMQLSLAAYNGMVHDPETGGWFHAVVPGVRNSPQRGRYLADCAASIWRITGEMPDVPNLVPGGAHVRNDSSYFVSGRTEEWLAQMNRNARNLIRAQQPDGSYRYDGKYRRRHFENTASGICARPSHGLLEHAWYTGDPQSLAAGLKSLAYLKRFRTPRGAQTWEVPLHTPDILAAAYAVWANVLAYRMTDDDQYLAEARRWAITGLPFVYQWSNQPVMAYATTPVYGATNWVAPNWIGLPVQWCGTVYAYALLELAHCENERPVRQHRGDAALPLDWTRLAKGILICGEQMQYPDGPSIGCLPDVFNLKSQSRHPADINPGVLVSLRLRLAGHLDNLSVASNREHRIVAPFPVVIEDGRAVVQAPAEIAYQVLVDGQRMISLGGELGNVLLLK